MPVVMQAGFPLLALRMPTSIRGWNAPRPAGGGQVSRKFDGPDAGLGGIRHADGPAEVVGVCGHLKLDPHACVERLRRSGHDGARIGKCDSALRGCVSRIEIEVVAEGSELLVEEIVDQPINLHVIVDVVGRMQVDLGVAGKGLILVAEIAEENLAA